MPVEELQTLRKKYQDKADYFHNLGFEHLHNDFKQTLSLIDELITLKQPKEEETNV